MIQRTSLQFVLPTERFRSSFISAFEELPDNEKNDWIYLGPDASNDLIQNRFSEYVSMLREREETPAPHFVRGRTYWAIDNDQVVGRIGLRFELNEFLARYGGHIGYIVRPSARWQGVATAMLAYVLATPEAQSIGNVLLTCDEDNVASERVILTNGGVYESTVYPEGRVIGKKRFWIKTQNRQP